MMRTCFHCTPLRETGSRDFGPLLLECYTEITSSSMSNDTKYSTHAINDTPRSLETTVCV